MKGILKLQEILFLFQGSATASCITMPLTTAFTRLQLEDKRKSKGPITTMIELVKETLKLIFFG